MRKSVHTWMGEVEIPGGKCASEMSHTGLMIARWKLQPRLLGSEAVSAVTGKLSFTASKPRN